MLLLFFKERIRSSRLRKMGRTLSNYIYGGNLLTKVVYYFDLLRHRKFELINDLWIEDGHTNSDRDTRYGRILFRHDSVVASGIYSLNESPMAKFIIPWEYKDMLKELNVQFETDSCLHISYLQYSPDCNWLAVCYAYECSIFDVSVCLDSHVLYCFINDYTLDGIPVSC